MSSAERAYEFSQSKKRGRRRRSKPGVGKFVRGRRGASHSRLGFRQDRWGRLEQRNLRDGGNAPPVLVVRETTQCETARPNASSQLPATGENPNPNFTGSREELQRSHIYSQNKHARWELVEEARSQDSSRRRQNKKGRQRRPGGKKYNSRPSVSLEPEEEEEETEMGFRPNFRTIATEERRYVRHKYELFKLLSLPLSDSQQLYGTSSLPPISSLSDEISQLLSSVASEITDIQRHRIIFLRDWIQDYESMEEILLVGGPGSYKTTQRRFLKTRDNSNDGLRKRRTYHRIRNVRSPSKRRRRNQRQAIRDFFD